MHRTARLLGRVSFRLDAGRAPAGCGSARPIVGHSQQKLDAPHALSLLASTVSGNPVGYFLFSGEQHGFRKPANIQRCLDAELAFYAIEVFRTGLTF
jgi:hypothetical protein